jgi:hypothetical protein
MRWSTCQILDVTLLIEGLPLGVVKVQQESPTEEACRFQDLIIIEIIARSCVRIENILFDRCSGHGLQSLPKNFKFREEKFPAAFYFSQNFHNQTNAIFYQPIVVTRCCFIIQRASYPVWKAGIAPPGISGT